MNHRPTVDVECPICHKTRKVDAAGKRYMERKGKFSARCYRDRMFHRERTDRLPRPPHPAVDWESLVIVNRHSRVPVTCPVCKTVRNCHPGSVAAKVREGRFTGCCLPCSPKRQKREWVRLGPGRKIDPVKGYIWLTIGSLSGRDAEHAEAMRGARSYVLEHRLVMARTLGRSLLPNELVDHMDGVKTNNDPANLRLYVRGKNQPGETSGYGTYYDEWQRALARIRELEGR